MRSSRLGSACELILTTAMLSTDSGFSRSAIRSLGRLGQSQGEGEAEHGLPGSEQQPCRASLARVCSSGNSKTPMKACHRMGLPVPDITDTLQRSADPEQAVPHQEEGHTICTRSASLLHTRELPCCVTRAKARGDIGGMFSCGKLVRSF